jgi:glycogen synthase
MRSNDKTALAALNDAADAGEVKLLTRLTKGEYHQVLATSEVMVTLSTEENFGYCVAESLMYGAVPLMTPGLSHAEFLPPKPAFFFEGWGRGVLLTEELKLKYAQQVIDMLDTVSKTPDAIPIVSAYVNLGITQDNAGFAEKIALSLCAPRRIASDLAKLP